MISRVLTSVCWILIASGGVASAQVRNHSAAADTASVNRIILIDPGLSFGRAAFLFPPSLGSELPFQNPFMTRPEGDFGATGPFIGLASGPRVDLMSPLRLQFEKEKLSPFQNALGAVQLGAVGYLAYRHIKKYGLFR
jgi:hypothetical protein